MDDDDDEYQKKGVSSGGYMVTYGWVILMALIIGFLMWKLGVFSQSSPSIATAGFTKIKIQPIAAKLTYAGTFKAILTNNMGIDITLLSTGASVVHKDGKTCATVVPTCFTSQVVQDKQSFQFSVGGCQKAGWKVGDAYDVTVVIPYTINIGEVTTPHLEVGTVRGSVGE